MEHISYDLSKNLITHNIRDNEELRNLYMEGVKNKQITEFDDELLHNLSNMYYDNYSALFYMFNNLTNFRNMKVKIELMCCALKGRKYVLTSGITESTKRYQILERMNDFKSTYWFLVTENKKEYVYDMFSMIKIENELFKKLEHSHAHKLIPGGYVEKFIIDDMDKYLEYKGNDVRNVIPIIKKNLEGHRYENLLVNDLIKHEQFLETKYNGKQKKLIRRT